MRAIERRRHRRRACAGVGIGVEKFGHDGRADRTTNCGTGNPRNHKRVAAPLHERTCDDLVLMTGEGLRRLLDFARRLDLEPAFRDAQDHPRAKTSCAAPAKPLTLKASASRAFGTGGPMN